jgi:stage II sporulation protein D
MAANGAIPHPNQIAERKEVRVLLGKFHRASVAGLDLKVNGVILAGNSAFSLRCGSSQGQPFVDYGAGRSPIGRAEIEAPGGFFHLNGKLFRNRLTVVAQGNDCAVVNTVDMEKYLAGLINREMSPSWPIEAMKAQAVASRSYAYFQMRANSGKDYDLESTTQDQVYEGAASETAKSNRAAEETRGITLSFGNEVIKAYYHANCGGMTELPVAVWGTESPAFRPVICPYHRKTRDKVRWSLSLSKEQIRSALKKTAGILPAGFRRLASLEAGAPNPSRRLSDVQVSDDKGNNILVSANYFRNALGNTKVKSTTFQVHSEHGGYRLTGEGYGHGVGMCQVGARGMAEEGKTFRQILNYYYPLAQLKQL